MHAVQPFAGLWFFQGMIEGILQPGTQLRRRSRGIAGRGPAPLTRRRKGPEVDHREGDAGHGQSEGEGKTELHDAML